MTRPLTPAETALQAAKAVKPPLYPLNKRGHDRVEALANLLQLSEGLRQAVDEGRIAWGEIGDWKPDARCYPAAPGHYVIEVTSGYMDFLYALGRAMAGASVVYGPDGAEKNKQALTYAEIAALAASVLKDWQKHCQPGLWDLFWKEKRIAHADFPLAAPALDIAETLVTSAELFTIAHEVGHAARGLGLAPALHPNEEVAADLAGLVFYLPAAVSLLGHRSAFPGPAFAVRVIGSLSRCGVTFTEAYPPAAERLRFVLQGTRALCPSTQFFDEASTILVANMSFMDDIDRLIDPDGATATPPDEWHGLVGALAALQSLVTESLPPSTFLEMFERGLNGQKPATRRAIAQKLRRYYGPAPPEQSFFPESLRRPMGVALDQCIALMPNDRQALFKPA
jgi:hypothetical protein